MNQLRNTALILLAAGKSSRLGTPKQLLKFEGMTLLQRAIQAGLPDRQAGLDASCHPVIVVLGAYHKKISQEPYLAMVNPVINPNWEAGMGSSIKIGMQELLKGAPPEQLILMLCDQPFVDGELLRRLIASQQATGKGIIACSYQGTLGVPALFDRQYFPLLLEMDDTAGAKKIIQNHPEELAVVPFEQGGIDIDTTGDYRALIREE